MGAPLVAETKRPRAVTKNANDRRALRAQFLAVMANWPEGYKMLPVDPGSAPMLYKLEKTVIGVNVGDLEIAKYTAVVRRPKSSLYYAVPTDPMDENSWKITRHRRINGVINIYDVDYTVAMYQQVLYREGKPEDSWSFPETNAGAEERFIRLRPNPSAQLPGFYAWYYVSPNHVAVRVAWYNNRNEEVSEVLRVNADQTTEWHGVQFQMLPSGQLVEKADFILGTSSPQL